jgi:acylphosphatase
VVSAEVSVRGALQSKRYYISGMVQGVGFRYFVEHAARQLTLCGYVKNLRDGRVEVYAIGPGSSLQLLQQELERGPRGAFVSRVDEEEAAFESQFSNSFSIEYDA